LVDLLPKKKRKDPNRVVNGARERPQSRRTNNFRAEQAAKLIVTKTDQEIEQEILDANAGLRVQYMPMKIHMEKAAMALAVGWSQAKAARFAGIHPRQIAMSKIQGRLIQEVGRRVSPQKIATLEPLDLVRFYNMTTGGKDKGLDNVTVNIKYDTIFNAISATIQNPEHAGGEVEEDPEYGPEDLLLPGGDSSGD
jgi:hypothetical protein